MFNPTPEQIASILRSPLANVKSDWPLIKEVLPKYKITTDASVIAVLATIGTEVRTFKPINEYGGPKYFAKMYENRADLGNNQPGDGAKFHGRGYVQTTGRINYTALVKEIGADCVENPDLLLLPHNAAIALAFYFHTHGCADWSNKAWLSVKNKSCKFCQHDGMLFTGLNGYGRPMYRRPKFTEPTCTTCAWKTMRRTVNGGLNGWEVFKHNVDELSKLVK